MLSKKLLLLMSFVSISMVSLATGISGVITDANRDPLIGATVLLEGTSYSAVAGLDGSYTIRNVPPGTYQMQVRYIGYLTITKEIVVGEESKKIDLEMELDSATLGEVVVSGQTIRGSDAQARMIERNALNTVNVVSARSIELSPDITVAQVMQRVSGLSVERGSGGEARHAIVRGMDKRYNYTLINGVKIPSPENKNRYVPLDIFPAAMLERLEVSKSLTADMEGDAIGGAMNLVMKSAPSEFTINTDIQFGYDQMNLKNGFLKFDHRAVDRKSPLERYGSDYSATPEDFTTANMTFENIKPLPDILASLTIGDRIMDDRLGIMAGLSYQNTYKSQESYWYDVDVDLFGSGKPTLDKLQERYTSIHQQRYAGHTRLDYSFNNNHSISFYGGAYFLNAFEVRDNLDVGVSGRNFDPDGGTAVYSHKTRFRSTYQKIYNATFQGEHQLSPRIEMDWGLVYSLATNERPDNSIFIRNGELKDHVVLPQNIERRNPRRWENNDDQDISTSVNLKYNYHLFSDGDYIKVGALGRTRDRSSFFNRYIFDPANPALQNQGEHWDTYEDVSWQLLNPRGSTSDPLNFNSGEDILAVYTQTWHQLNQLDINFGVRAEHTRQFYELKTAREDVNPDSSQTYLDILPSVGLKWALTDQLNIRSSYYKAISRPGFHEIVPFRRGEEDGFTEAGNPNLKRVRADNFDLRLEYFPGRNEQILLGFFYKRLKDPIELTLARSISLTQGERQLIPGNFGEAINYGLEFDFTKYFNKIGIRANYTYTNSQITTTKILPTREDPEDSSSELIFLEIDETRPLQGQADHIANLSLLFKDMDLGTDVQVSFVYTGERIEFVSPFLENNHWSKPLLVMDFSFEQKVGDHTVVFLKVGNLLNTQNERFIDLPNRRQDEVTFPHQDLKDKTLVRRDTFDRNYRIGARFNL